MSKVKSSRGPKIDPAVKAFTKSVQDILVLPKSPKYAKLVLPEYPFDAELLSLSPTYLISRKLYLKLGGQFRARVCSTMRSLSATNLFGDEIEYSPLLSEIIWFHQNSHEVSDPKAMMNAIVSFNEISLFHEQNHRIIWRLLPPAPREQTDLRRYLNFAESLVVTLDLVLGDELGPKVSKTFESVRSIYRPGATTAPIKKSNSAFRSQLLILTYATYLLLELVDKRDIPKALEYVFPDHLRLIKSSYKRALELSELFTETTNREWQRRYWKQAQERLAAIHSNTEESELYLPEDPLDFEEEFVIASRVFDVFGL